MILNLKPSQIEGKLPTAAKKPVIIHRNGLEAPTTIKFESGKEAIGSCMRCPLPPCQKYGLNETEHDYFPDFPAEATTKVCPTDAIHFEMNNGVPNIVVDKCILCGLCVARCPVQAIVLTEKGPKVNDAENDLFRLTGKPVDKTAVAAITQYFRTLPIEGVIAECNIKFATSVYERISAIGMGTYAQFPNTLARNIMNALSVPFQIRRLGDTNMRIDGVFKAANGRIGVAEIEFSDAAILDSPRDILDDCAVLNSRHAFPVTNIDPLIITLRLPNKRSEYWRVIQDISNVLNIKIASITIGAMLHILWTNHKLNTGLRPKFYADAKSPTIEPAIRDILKEDICDAGAALGWYGSIK